MKIGASLRHAMLVAMAAACSAQASVAQFGVENVAVPPHHGASVGAGAAHQPRPQHDASDWYASPSCDESGDCAGGAFLGGQRLRDAARGGRGGFFGGIDYLLLRPHFSEAIAFARGTQDFGGPTPTMNLIQEPLDFDYQSSLRAHFGYRSASGDTDLRFTYWYIDADTAVNAGNPGPGAFIVDPFGNLVGSAVVMNPADQRVGTLIDMGGDSIATRASVRLNIYDIDLGLNITPQNPNWNIEVRAGTRIADINQFYDSVVSDNVGAEVARGDFNVDFVGAGPRLGAGISRIFGQQGQFRTFTQGSGALLLGQYDLTFSNTVAGAGAGSQLQSMTRLIPVVDMEAGGAWRVTDNLTLAGGYLFQAWFDMGVSGGKFDGFFSGTDDANIMSFDGLFARAEWAF